MEWLLTLAVLACPVAMGLMMWMMMRGGKQEPTGADAVSKQAELSRLQAQIDQLQAARDYRRTDPASRPQP